MKLTHRQRSKIFKVNSTMEEIHNRTNTIYEQWMEDEYPEMKETIQKQILALKNILNGIEEEI
jgi:hypothetical protein